MPSRSGLPLKSSQSVSLLKDRLVHGTQFDCTCCNLRLLRKPLSPNVCPISCEGDHVVLLQSVQEAWASKVLSWSILHQSCGFHLRTSWMRFHPRVGENFIETCHRVTIKHSQGMFEAFKLPLLHPPSPAHQTGYQLLPIQPWNYRCVQLKSTTKLKEK